MVLINSIQDIVDAGAEQFLLWATELLPKVFLFLILLNAVTSMIGRARVEKLAARCGSNPLLRYLVLPFLSAIVLGNPMAISMGRYLPERYKPAYFASASYHCHTNSGIFQHINPAELFLWLGIANGVMSLGYDLFPLALRYMAAGLVANYVSGYATEMITRQVEKRQGIRLDRTVDLWTERESEEADTHVQTVAENTVDETASERSDPAAAEVSGIPGKDISGEKTGYRTITITRGDGGYGGPVTVTSTKERHKVLYMTGGNLEPEPLARIISLSGMESVNGNQESCPDEEVALAIIDCGGTLRCGIYPGKGIPTVNILATGRSGPLAKYMTEDMYVSAVTSECVEAVAAENLEEAAAENLEEAAPEKLEEAAPEKLEEAAPESTAESGTECASEVSEAENPAGAGSPPKTLFNKILEPILTISKIVSLFQQSARDAVRTCLEMILPFMGFAALFIGICNGSGLTQFLAGLMKPMEGSLPGLMAVGVICSVPGLSAILGAGAVAAQMFSTVIGELIAEGSIAPAMALPALFAINCQCACDFIPVGLGMTEAKPETTQVGIASVTISRFVTGWIRILIAVVFSIGLYR